MKQNDLSKQKDLQSRFADVFMPHFGEAYRLARWLTGNRSDAEDVVQDASLRAFNGIQGYRGTNSKAWVLTIVRNTAYSWLAKKRSAALLFTESLDAVDESAASSSSAADAPDAALIMEADASELEQALSRVPVPFREVLIMREMQGLSYQEIAGVSGLPLGTVMSRLARARRLLISQLAGKSS